MLCGPGIPRSDERFVCIAIIAFSPHPLLCQTNDFLPFCAQVCVGRCSLCKHSERKSRSVSLDLCFRRTTDMFHTGLGKSPQRRLRSGRPSSVKMVLLGATPLPLCVNGTVHLKKGACHLSVLCVLSTVSCRSTFHRGSAGSHTHMHTHSHNTHTHTHARAVMRCYRTLRHTLHTRSALLADTRFPHRMSPLKEED